MFGSRAISPAAPTPPSAGEWAGGRPLAHRRANGWNGTWLLHTSVTTPPSEELAAADKQLLAVERVSARHDRAPWGCCGRCSMIVGTASAPTCNCAGSRCSSVAETATGADPRHLGRGNSRIDSQSPCEVVHAAGGNSVYVGLHHHREQCLVDPSAGLENRGAKRALAQFRDPPRGRSEFGSLDEGVASRSTVIPTIPPPRLHARRWGCSRSCS